MQVRFLIKYNISCSSLATVSLNVIFLIMAVAYLHHIASYFQVCQFSVIIGQYLHAFLISGSEVFICRPAPYRDFRV